MNGPQRIREKFESVQNASLPIGIENGKIIPLTQGYVAAVDAEDYEKLSTFNWSAKVKPGGMCIYAVRSWYNNSKK